MWRNIPFPKAGSASSSARRSIATASPAFVRRWFPDGLSEEALRQAPCLTFDIKDALQDRWLVETFGRPISRPSHWIPSSRGFVDAALAGLGWGMNPLSLVRPNIEEGSLVAIHPGSRLLVPLYWHWSRAVEKGLQDITASILRTARARLEQA